MKLILLPFLFLFLFSTSAQISEWGAGGSVIYNLQTNGIGFGGRAYFSLGERFAISPKYNFYPGFNLVHESYLGVDLHYKLNPWNRWHLYVLGEGVYNKWKNYAQFTSPRAQLRNYGVEAGVGIMKSSGCIRPLGEWKYNVKWKEGNLRLGILIFFQDCLGGGATVNGYRRGKYVCP